MEVLGGSVLRVNREPENPRTDDLSDAGPEEDGEISAEEVEVLVVELEGVEVGLALLKDR